MKRKEKRGIRKEKKRKKTKGKNKGKEERKATCRCGRAADRSRVT